MKMTQAKAIAVGGVLAAMAVVIQGLGGLIPIATSSCRCCVCSWNVWF